VRLEKDLEQTKKKRGALAFKKSTYFCNGYEAILKGRKGRAVGLRFFWWMGPQEKEYARRFEVQNYNPLSDVWARFHIDVETGEKRSGSSAT